MIDQDIKLLKKGCFSADENQYLLSRLKTLKLLAHGSTNAKLSKGSELEYLSLILYFQSGKDVCPWATDGCLSACLDSAGRGRFSNVKLSRLRKKLFFKIFRSEFLAKLDTEIARAKIKVKKEGKKAVCVRLNGTSDLPYELYKLTCGLTLIQKHPDVIFYDYTKSVQRALNSVKDRTLDQRFARAKNYSLVFSYSGENYEDCMRVLEAGGNVAIVFDGKDFEGKTWKGYPVVDGDKHDFRFLDDRGVVVALSAKGDAKGDNSGFVRSINELKGV